MNIIVNVKVIGGDGAFSEDNSSFLISFKDIILLFDCPVNTFNYIMKYNINAQHVFVSHTHFDHISGLEQLFYYNYFVKNKITKVYAGEEVLDELKKIFEKSNFVYDNGSLVAEKIVEFLSVEELNDKLKKRNVEIRTIKGNHIVKHNYGLVMIFNDLKKVLVITGDTKASQEIADEINWLLSYDELYVFHDYSEIDNVFKNIHCCETDFNYYYKELIENNKVKWFKYHNKTFNKEFKDKTIIIK